MDLGRERYIGFPEFMTQAPLIDTFQQSWAERAMDTHRETDDAICEVVVIHFVLGHVGDPGCGGHYPVNPLTNGE